MRAAAWRRSTNLDQLLCRDAPARQMKCCQMWLRQPCNDSSAPLCVVVSAFSAIVWSSGRRLCDGDGSEHVLEQRHSVSCPKPSISFLDGSWP
jgi:hypothetical protein